MSTYRMHQEIKFADASMICVFASEKDCFGQGYIGIIPIERASIVAVLILHENDRKWVVLRTITPTGKGSELTRVWISKRIKTWAKLRDRLRSVKTGLKKEES